MKVLITSLIFIVSSFLFSANQVERVNSESYYVRFEYRVANSLDQPQDITIYLSLPLSNERQKINYFFYDKPDEELIDRFGNKILIYRFLNVLPNEVCQAGWFVDCDVYAAIYPSTGNRQQLSKKENILYLQDSPNYLITSPIIQKTLKKIISPSSSVHKRAFQIFDFLIKNINYYRDDRWDTAVDVLQKKQGSCSEYNYVFISLLRAAGIPARYTGGSVLHPDYQTRYDVRIYEDAIFHRWTEFFSEESGWFPADASRGSTARKRFDNVKNLWGRLPVGLLQTYRGDGGDELPLGWDYVATNRVSSKKAESRKDAPVAYWIKKDDQQNLPQLIEKIQKKINHLEANDIKSYCADYLQREVLLYFSPKIKNDLYPVLIAELLKNKHPQAVYFSLLMINRHLPLDRSLRYEMFCSGLLINEIKKVLKSEWNWAFFEYWWRKARSLIYFDEQKKEFTLSTTDIDIY